MATAESTARRRASERANKRARRNLRAIKGAWPERDEKYKAWIRTLPCLGCWPEMWRGGEVWTLHAVGWQPFVNTHCVYPNRGIVQESPTEAAHSGPHAMSQKASDYTCVPLCGFHHREAKDAQGKSRTWFEDHGLDRDAVISELRKRYEQEHA